MDCQKAPKGVNFCLVSPKIAHNNQQVIATKNFAASLAVAVS
jgi:hypothetical protein